MTLLSITPDTWYMAGICVAVVFAILIVLVIVLNIFSIVAKSVEHASHVAQTPDGGKPIAAGVHKEDADEEQLAAVATAVYLYLNSAHDEESGVITLNQTPSAGWHAVLNPRF